MWAYAPFQTDSKIIFIITFYLNLERGAWSRIPEELPHLHLVQTDPNYFEIR